MIAHTATLPRAVPGLPKVSADRAVLKRYVWVYLVLLLLEGALRKWVLPFAAQPLLVVRDPIALYLIYRTVAGTYRLLNAYVLAVGVLTTLSFLFTFYQGHQNFYVAVYGLRITLLHFPLMFVIGQVLDRSDVERIGKFLLWVALPMAVLIGLQYFSPQTAWVNRGIGGDLTGGGFSGAGGFLRPPATFSFTNGTTLFFGLVAAFVLYFWQMPQRIGNRWLLIAATVAILVAVPMTLSRGYLMSLLLSTAFFVLLSLRSGRSLGRMIGGLLLVPVLGAVLVQIEFVQIGLRILELRFANAAQSEGGLEQTIGTRIIGGMVHAVTTASDQPFWGNGLGMGTNFGSQLLTGTRRFLLAEGEWGRIIGERGALLGLGLITLRVVLCFHLVWRALLAWAGREPLSLFLCSVGLLMILKGNWAQPTALGFAVVVGGMMIAALYAPADGADAYLTDPNDFQS